MFFNVKQLFLATILFTANAQAITFPWDFGYGSWKDAREKAHELGEELPESAYKTSLTGEKILDLSKKAYVLEKLKQHKILAGSATMVAALAVVLGIGMYKKATNTANAEAARAEAARRSRKTTSRRSRKTTSRRSCKSRSCKS